MSIKTLMLTGDNQGAADRVAQTLGIQQVFANVRPGDKANVIAKLKLDGENVVIAP